MSHELTKNKIIMLKCHLLLFYTTANHFLAVLWRVMKSGFYITNGDDWLNDWTEKKLQSTSQSQVCIKKWSWSLFGLLPVRSTTYFWILVKSLHLRSMRDKLMRYTENCSACSQYWSTQRAQIFSTTMLDSTLYNQCFKSWVDWALKVEWILPHPPYLPDLSPANYQLLFKHLDNFLQGKLFHN